MSAAVGRDVKMQSRPEVFLNYSSMTKNQLFYLYAWCLRAHLPDVVHRPMLSDEVFASLSGNMKMAMKLSIQLEMLKDSTVASVTPFTWDETKTDVKLNIVPGQASHANLPDKKYPSEQVTVAKKTVDVLRVDGIPITMPLRDITPAMPVSKFDMVAANAAIAVGNLTERRPDGKIKAAIGVNQISKLKIPYISQASITNLCQTVYNAVQDSIKVQAGVSGLVWMRMFYDQMVSLPQDERFYLCTRILSAAYVKAPFLRDLMPPEKKMLTKMIGKTKVDFKQFKVQTGVAKIGKVSLGEAISAQSVLQGCIQSRDFRKTDGSGMSGANQGAYTGEFVTKATRVLRSRLAVLSTIVIPQDMMLYIYTNDTKFIRLIPQVMKVKHWCIVSSTTMEIKGVKIVNYVRNLNDAAAIIYPDLKLPTWDPKADWDTYLGLQKVALFNVLQPYLALKPAALIYPCKVLQFDWSQFIPLPDGQKTSDYERYYTSREFVGPTPHNLEYMRVTAVKAANGVRVTAPVNFPTYLQCCNVSNSFRNTYFLHRKPINEVLSEYQLPYVPDISLVPPPPLKPETESELRNVIDSGEATADQMVEYFSKFSIEKDDDSAGSESAGDSNGNGDDEASDEKSEVEEVDRQEKPRERRKKRKIRRESTSDETDDDNKPPPLPRNLGLLSDG